MSLKMPTKAQKAIIERQEGFQEATDKSRSDGNSDDSRAGKLSESPKEKDGNGKVDVTLKASVPAKKQAKEKKSISSPPSEVTEPLVPQTFKIPRSLSEKIKIVSVTRKVKKNWPYTQQEIVSEALSDWFEKVGE